MKILTSILIILLALTVSACDATTTTDQQTPATDFTDDERAVLLFVNAHVTDLERLNQILFEITDAVASGDYDASTDAIERFGDLYVEVNDEWEEIPVANGRVRRLERQFDHALNDLRDVFNAIYDILDGKSDKPAYAAIERYDEHYDATIEELHDLVSP